MCAADRALGKFEGKGGEAGWVEPPFLMTHSESLWKPGYTGLEFEKILVSYIICYTFPCVCAFPYMHVKMEPQRR